MICLGNKIAPKYCISDSFVDYEGYSVSSKGFLPMVVDIMVIWIKSTCSHPLWFTESVDVHSCHLFDHFQFTLIHGPNVPGSYALLLFTLSNLASNKSPYSQGYGFSSGHVWMWELDCEESWVPKNWCFWTVMLEKTLESSLDCKETHQSILKEISPEYSLEGLMLKLKLQYFST